MDIVEPVEKAAALHVDAGETAKVVVEAEVHTNIDSLKRRHSEEVAREHENEAKKPKTSNNGENAEEDDDDDLIAKLDAIEAPVLSNEITKPADLLKKLEEDGKSDDLLERMECIVEGKTPSHSTRQTDTDNGVVTKPEEVPQVDERPKEEAIKSAEEKEAPKPAEAKEEPKKVEISQNKEESKKPEKEEPKRVEEIKKDVPKVEEVKEAQPSKPEEPKEQAEAKSEDTKMPKVKVAEVEKMEVDGDVKAEGKSPKKTAPVAENDENVISSTTECVTFEKKETPPPKAAPEPKNSPKETLSNIPASKPAPAAKELPPMAVAKEKPAEVKKDEKEMPRENDKETAKVIEKIEETPKKTAEERKDAEALPAEKVVEAAKMQKQHNGLITSTDPASTTSDEEKEMKMEVDGEAEAKSPVKDTPSISNGEDLADAVVKENTYEVKFCFEENDIKYLYIDKMTKDGVNGNEKNTTASQSTTDESSNTDKFAVPTQPNSTVTIKGISSLCSFIVERMRMLNPVEEKKVAGRKSLGAKTPTSTSKSQKASPAVTKVTSSGRRSTGKTSTTSTPVKASSTTTKADSGAKDSKVGYSVMARWVDKMYYAGKVSAEKTGGKFVIHFEDGALKTLQRDNIVFGHENLLPFLNQSVHALVEGDTYEPGLVTEVAMDPDGQILYTVIAESKTVVRSASDIYLEDDQAKSIQAAIKDNPQTGLVDLATVKRVSRRSSSASESDGSSRKNSRKSDSKEAEAGFSGGDAKKGRRGKRVEPPPPVITLNESQSSDISDIPDTETVPQSPECSALEAIDGVQPELQKTVKEIDRIRRWYFDECLKNGRSLDDLLGPVPNSKSLFRNKSFILTVTFEGRFTKIPNYDSHRVPFFKDHLQKQIVDGGGKVYEHWEDLPKTKYSNCKLIAPFPCTTAKYIQCLATGIYAVSHEWIIESCKEGKTLDFKDYLLPSGYSIIEKRYIEPVVKRVSSNSRAFADLNILLTSENKDFGDFWSRVCKLAGASSVRIVKSVDDISTIEKGFLLVGGEVSPVLIEKAKDFDISVVSTVWVVQSLIAGTCCSADSHESLTKLFTDDC